MPEPVIENQTEDPQDEELRTRVVRGGVFLVARQSVGAVAKLVGFLALSKILSPAEFGVYSAGLAVCILVGAFLPMGLPTLMIRQEGELRSGDLDLLFTYLLMAGLSVAGIGWVVYFVGVPAGLDAEFLLALAGLLTAWLLQFLFAPSRVILDRGLRFAERGTIEVINDVVFYAVTVVLGLMSYGYKAPVIGQIVSNLWVLLAMQYRSKYRPRLNFDLARARELMVEGRGYAVLGVGIHLFDSLIVLLAGPLLGKEGAGYVGFAQGLAKRAGVIRVAANDLAVAALSKIQSEPGRLRTAHAEGTLLHAVSTLAIVAGLALFGPVLVPALFGAKWVPAVGILGYLCLQQAISVMFDMDVGVLMVLNKTTPVIVQKALQGAITAVLLLALVPAFGAAGYGPAIALGTLSFLVLEWAIRREFSPDHGVYLLLFVASVPMFAAPFVAPSLRPILVLPELAALLWPRQRRQIVALYSRTWASLRGRRG